MRDLFLPLANGDRAVAAMAASLRATASCESDMEGVEAAPALPLAAD